MSITKNDKVIKREIVQIFTKGTYSTLETEENEPNSKFIMSIRVENSGDKKKEVGVTLMDSATYYITVGHFQDDEHWTQLKTLLCQFRPVEIVID